MVKKKLQKLPKKRTNFLLKNIYVENYGCSANAHDLEIILGYLRTNKYIIEKTNYGIKAIKIKELTK